MVLSGWAQKLKPVHSKKIERKGKVKSSKFRRPHLSIVNRAGMAKTQFRIPVPMDASRAELVEYPESMKMVVE